MNSVKTVFVIAVLGAVAFGAYLSITHKQQLPGPTTEAPPFVSMPGNQAPAGGHQANLAPPAVTAVPNVQYGTEAGGPLGSLPSDSNMMADLSQGTPSPLPFPASQVSYGSPTGADRPPANLSADDFTASMKIVQEQLDASQLKQAHLALTNLYKQPDLRPYQRSQIIELLDQLAGGVIYSRDHLLEPPYMVKAGDTLKSIARAYDVPSQLLANINGIDDRNPLELGQQLKVVRGPFNAVLNLSDYELTLMVGGRYAGRFPIGVGEDCAQLAGSQTLFVSSKTANPTYYGPGNEQIKPGDPNNPLGGYSIGLSEANGAPTRISIHGTNSPVNLHQTGGRGAVSLDAKDIQDIFGILSAGPVPQTPGGATASKVTIVR